MHNLYEKQSHVGYAFLFAYLMAFIHSSGACEFPASMQSNVTSRAGGGVLRDWRGRIKNQFTEFTLRMEIGRKVLSVVSEDAGEVRSHTRGCVRALSGGKYVVAHEEAGQIGNKFSCMQFVQRSPDVVQIRSAVLSDKLDLGLCSETKLIFDKWLFIDKAHIGRDPQSCPLQGGYILGLFDKLRGQGVCDAWRGEVRLESECVPGDGLTFYFRTQKCVPEDLMMFSTQPVLCLANWKQGAYSYSVLRHESLPYFWLLRVPVVALNPEQTEGFSGYLYKDLVAESVEFSSDTVNYIRMDMMRDVERDLTRLCADDYEICSVHLQTPCAGRQSNLALTCPLTCGVCTRSSHEICNLPSGWKGKWKDGGGSETTGKPTRSAAIDGSTITLHSEIGAGNITYQCVRWNSSSGKTNDQMLVQTYGRGCRPRYTCAKAFMHSSELLYLKLSLPTMWPFTKSRDELMDCDSFTYDVPRFGPTAGAEDFAAATKQSLLFYTDSNQRTPVDCELPDVILISSVTFQNSDWGTSDFKASLKSVNESQSNFKLILDDYKKSSVVKSMMFLCLDTSILASTGDQLIVTEMTNTSQDRTLLYCWIFKKSIAGTTSKFYLLNGTQCHQATRAKARLEQIYQYIAMFTGRISRAEKPTVTTISQNTTIPILGRQSSVSTLPALSSKKYVTRRPSLLNLSTLLNRTSRNRTSIKLTSAFPPVAANNGSMDIKDTNRNVFTITSAQLFLAIIILFFICRCVS